MEDAAGQDVVATRIRSRALYTAGSNDVAGFSHQDQPPAFLRKAEKRTQQCCSPERAAHM
ncbi:hypothetical protein DQK91_04490 [Oceanidesulfovibrio marinus]|uniref:Uncharacterized protein n=1 Tax=Oceanidesulfovibrio marinus TaxID=370038 RepID=A0A6P1ZNN1_9BACT|nr:hypothetical protein DQK91_04490 [Oceanidesulfovibrio marinus]